MEQQHLDQIYNNAFYQDTRWKDLTTFSTDFIRSMTPLDIKIFHHNKLSQLSMIQKLAFTDEQKSHMNPDQLAAVAS